MAKQVFVVTDVESGWDCVVACIDASNITEADVRKEFPQRTYIITKMKVDDKVVGLDDDDDDYSDEE